jgi:hypothetical protein
MSWNNPKNIEFRERRERFEGSTRSRTLSAEVLEIVIVVAIFPEVWADPVHETSPPSPISKTPSHFSPVAHKSTKHSNVGISPVPAEIAEGSAFRNFVLHFLGKTEHGKSD